MSRNPQNKVSTFTILEIAMAYQTKLCEENGQMVERIVYTWRCCCGRDNPLLGARVLRLSKEEIGEWRKVQWARLPLGSGMAVSALIATIVIATVGFTNHSEVFQLGVFLSVFVVCLVSYLFVYIPTNRKCRDARRRILARFGDINWVGLPEEVPSTNRNAYIILESDESAKTQT